MTHKHKHLVLLLFALFWLLVIIYIVQHFGQRNKLVTPIPTAVTVQVPPPTHPDPLTIHSLVNDERVKAGLQPLVLDDRLEASAKEKCDDMVANKYHAHESPSGVSWKSFIRAHYKHYETAGENLAWGYNTSQGDVTGWMNSPLHKANILKPSYTEVGYAVCQGGDIPDLVVEHFAAD